MENPKKYRLTKHQSELAIRVTGESQADLFANSAFTLFDVMVMDVDKVEARERIPLEVEGTDRDDLMVNWMRELLYLYQGSGSVKLRTPSSKPKSQVRKSILTATKSNRKSPPLPFTRAAWIKPATSGPRT